MIRPLFLALLTVASWSVSAQTPPLLGVGDPLPALELKDQHERPASVPASTRQIIFAADNGGAGLATDYLDARGAAWMQAQGVVYLADIHKMPALIGRMFALPKLREKPYPIVLGREAGDLAMFPRQKDCLTLLPVTAGKLGTARYACNAAELAAALN